MKKTTMIALSGIIAALSVVIMLLAWFPFLTYALPAMAGCLLIILVFETGKKHALLVYVAVSIVSVFFCNPEAYVMYIAIFGYYPIVKALIERINKRAIEWIMKLLLFNATFTASYLFTTYVLGIDTDSLGELGRYSFIVLMVLANVMFVVYDIALSKIITDYSMRYRKKLTKYIGK